MGGFFPEDGFSSFSIIGDGPTASDAAATCFKELPVINVPINTYLILVFGCIGKSKL